jgi:hypothetical protein
MDSFREQKFYLYARDPLLRPLMKRAYRWLSGYDLHRVDAEARARREATGLTNFRSSRGMLPEANT